MYAQYYNLTGVPFQLTPDSRFYFGSSGHSRAIAHLVYGLAQEEGFIIITGEVGAGKTTLVEQLWSQLDRKTYTIARVVTTQVSGDDLLRLVCNGFGITTDATDKATLLQRLEWLFRDQRDSGRRCLLVVDEVQSLSIGALEELRMLSNLTAGGRASLQTILLGQPQFRATWPVLNWTSCVSACSPPTIWDRLARRRPKPISNTACGRWGGRTTQAGTPTPWRRSTARPAAFPAGSTRSVHGSSFTALLKERIKSRKKWSI